VKRLWLKLFKNGADDRSMEWVVYGASLVRQPFKRGSCHILCLEWLSLLKIVVFLDSWNVAGYSHVSGVVIHSKTLLSFLMSLARLEIWEVFLHWPDFLCEMEIPLKLRCVLVTLLRRLKTLTKLNGIFFVGVYTLYWWFEGTRCWSVSIPYC